MGFSSSLAPWIPVLPRVLFSSYYSSHSLFSLDDLILTLHSFNYLMSPKYVSLYQTLLRLLSGFSYLMTHPYLKFNILNAELIPPTHTLTPLSQPLRKSHLFLYSPSQLNVPLWSCYSSFVPLSHSQFSQLSNQQVVTIYDPNFYYSPPYHHFPDSGLFHHTN